MKRALVTGANGHVGSALIPLLISEGWNITGLVRKTSNLSAIEKYPVDLIYGDMADPQAIKKAVDGCEAIFHLAAPTIAKTLSDKTSALDGVKNICEFAGNRRVIYVSSTVTVGIVSDVNQKLDETSWVHLTGTPYQDLKWDAEQKVIEYIKDKNRDIVIVNPSTIIGAGDLRPMPPNRLIIDFLNYAGSWLWLKDFQLKGAPVWFNTGLSVVSVGDVARGIYQAHKRGRSGERYILSGDNITIHQMHEKLSEITGLPTPFIYTPKPLIYTASWICTKLMKHPPMSYSLAKTMIGRYAFFSSAKAKQELGYSWTPYQTTLLEAVEWFLKTSLVLEGRKIKILPRLESYKKNIPKA